MQQRSEIELVWNDFWSFSGLCALSRRMWCLPSSGKIHENRDILKQLLNFGLWLTNIRKDLLFLIRTDIGLFLMLIITSNSTLSHNSAKDWFWLYGVARKHPSPNVGEKIFLLHSIDFLELCMLYFKMMCELNIFIKWR